MDFAALQQGTPQGPESGIRQQVSPPSPPPDEALPAPAAKLEGNYKLRGKWLQFDCPHCVRPMRLIADDAGSLVDCAHCGLELIAPDPALGRGARLSRASEGRVGSIARYNLRDLRGDKLRQTKSHEEAESLDPEEDEEAGFADLDPHHSLARGAVGDPFEAAPAGRRKRAVKALDPGKIGRSFRRQDMGTEEAAESHGPDWEKSRPRHVFGESHRDRRGFWIAAGVAAAVMVTVAAMVAREAGSSGEVFDRNELSEIHASQKQQHSRFQASFEAAKRALASPDWETLLLHVRRPEKVAAMMRTHYAQQAYAPIEITGFHAAVDVHVGGLSLHEMRVTLASGETRMVVMEDRPDGAKLDWELLVNMPNHDWEQFLDTRPAKPREIRVVVSRSSLQDRFFADAGLKRDEAVGLRLWHVDPDVNYFAVLPKDSPLGQKMIELLAWDVGRKLILEASFDPRSQLPTRVRIEALVQTGWVEE